MSPGRAGSSQGGIAERRNILAQSLSEQSRLGAQPPCKVCRHRLSAIWEEAHPSAIPALAPAALANTRDG